MRRRKWQWRPPAPACAGRNLDFVLDLRSEQHERTDGHGESRFENPGSCPRHEMATLPTFASAAGGLCLWRWWRRRNGPADEHASSDDFTSSDAYGSAERSGWPVEDDPGLHPGLL